MELFITLCIVVNTLFMALDHHDMDKSMEKILKSGNYVSIGGDDDLDFFFLNLTKFSENLYFAVFHGHIRHRSNHETLRNESEILFPSRLEYIRFYYCVVIIARARAGGCSRIVCVTVVSFGKSTSNTDF